MNIHNSKERKIKCIANNDRGDMCIHGSNAPLLEVGKEYTLVNIKVHSWYTEVYLEEFPNKVFNSVYFEEVGLNRYWRYKK